MHWNLIKHLKMSWWNELILEFDIGLFVCLRNHRLLSKTFANICAVLWLIMATEVDIITKRPRTPNEQYTVLTDEQIKNVNQVI